MSKKVFGAYANGMLAKNPDARCLPNVDAIFPLLARTVTSPFVRIIFVDAQASAVGPKSRLFGHLNALTRLGGNAILHDFSY